MGVSVWGHAKALERDGGGVNNSVNVLTATNTHLKWLKWYMLYIFYHNKISKNQGINKIYLKTKMNVGSSLKFWFLLSQHTYQIDANNSLKDLQ